MNRPQVIALRQALNGVEFDAAPFGRAARERRLTDLLIEHRHELVALAEAKVNRCNVEPVARPVGAQRQRYNPRVSAVKN